MPKFLAPAGVRGLCYPGTGNNPDWWTNDEPADRLLALKLCLQCPIIQICRAEAEKREERYCVAGGVDWELKVKQSDGRHRERCPHCFNLVLISEGKFKPHTRVRIDGYRRMFCPMSRKPFEAVTENV